MATIRFYLRSPKQNGILRKDEVSVLAKFTIDRKHRFEVTLDEKVMPRHWDFKGQCVKSTYRGHYEVNIYLSDFKTKLLTLYRENRELPFDQFKKLATLGSVTKEKKTLFEALEKFMTVYKAEKDKKTLAKYFTLQTQLKAFSLSYDFDLSTLDYNFYDSFKKYLFSIPNPNYSKYRLLADPDNSGGFLLTPGNSGDVVGIFDDTVYKYFINLKTFCAWAEKRGYQVHPSFKNWEIITRKHAPISLTIKELEKLENTVMPNKSLDLARDYLVMECRTGQRISDLKRFDLRDYENEKWTFSPRKGNRIASKTTTVHFKGYCAPALLIIQKYNYQLPKISEQKLNKNIKLACKAAGIDQELITYRWAQNKKVKMVYPKYEHISTHSGRKTFITIALQHMPPKIVMDLVGIDKYDTLKHYEGASESSVIENYLTGIQDSKAVMRKAN